MDAFNTIWVYDKNNQILEFLNEEAKFPEIIEKESMQMLCRTQQPLLELWKLPLYYDEHEPIGVHKCHQISATNKFSVWTKNVSVSVLHSINFRNCANYSFIFNHPIIKSHI